MQQATHTVEPLLMREPAIVGQLRQAAVFFQALQYAGNANLDEFIQIAAGDGEKFHLFQQWVGGVVSLFQHSAVEEQPAFVAVDVTGVQEVRLCCACGTAARTKTSLLPRAFLAGFRR